jgi:hypothetical protein
MPQGATKGNNNRLRALPLSAYCSENPHTALSREQHAHRLQRAFEWMEDEP